MGIAHKLDVPGHKLADVVEGHVLIGRKVAKAGVSGGGGGCDS